MATRTSHKYYFFQNYSPFTFKIILYFSLKYNLFIFFGPMAIDKYLDGTVRFIAIFSLLILISSSFFSIEFNTILDKAYSAKLSHTGPNISAFDEVISEVD